jgi:hypothetical protein
MRVRIIALAAFAALVATPAVAAEKIYSYDPANAQTRALVDNGLTFVFERNLFGFRMKELLATQASVAAEVEPAAERELGARLERLLPAGAGERALYRITDAEQGPAMIRVLCPGSTRAWLVFGAPRPRRDLTMHAIGDDPQTGAARYCTSLELTFRGEWLPPPPAPYIPDLPTFAPGRY